MEEIAFIAYIYTIIAGVYTDPKYLSGRRRCIRRPPKALEWVARRYSVNRISQIGEVIFNGDTPCAIAICAMVKLKTKRTFSAQSKT